MATVHNIDLSDKTGINLKNSSLLNVIKEGIRDNPWPVV